MSAVNLAQGAGRWALHAPLDKAVPSTAHDSPERLAKAVILMLLLLVPSQTTYLCLLCLQLALQVATPSVS